jgi:hypothetical protein
METVAELRKQRIRTDVQNGAVPRHFADMALSPCAARVGFRSLFLIREYHPKRERGGAHRKESGITNITNITDNEATLDK